MTSRPYDEINFDGLVGPTHNYAGLSFGNVASKTHQNLASNPREAALQGLEKMKFLMDLGFPQGVLPPQERPLISTLKNLGFSGSDQERVARAFAYSPSLVTALSSASCMWTANAATMAPSVDSGHAHFTPANLISKIHRSLEAPSTSRIFRAVFKGDGFKHHPPLHPHGDLGDEGAANHTRFCSAAEYGSRGVHLFVYGKKAFGGDASPKPQKFPARQTLEASEAVARLHELTDSQVIFAQQNPEAIDAGVFHNDVVAVGNQNVFFHHELAFLDSAQLIAELKSKLKAACGAELVSVQVPKAKVSLPDAVSSYLFNSQLVTLRLGSAKGKMALIAPVECQENPAVSAYLTELLSQGSPIAEVHYLNLRQSMRNGGGPACLRFRAVLSADETSALAKGVLLTNAKYLELKSWVERNYRDHLHPSDLGDPKLLTEGRKALDELTTILGIGSVYDFQK
jgi:succinylarginine dihydrolase